MRYFYYIYMYGPFWAFINALVTDPDDIFYVHRVDPYRPWVLWIANAKRWLFPSKAYSHGIRVAKSYHVYNPYKLFSKEWYAFEDGWWSVS